MKNQLKKKNKSININLKKKKIILKPLKLLEKVNLNKFVKITKNSLTISYANFKKKTKTKRDK